MIEQRGARALPVQAELICRPQQCTAWTRSERARREQMNTRQGKIEMIKEIKITLEMQLAAASENAVFYLQILKDEPENEHAAIKFATWQALIQSLEELQEWRATGQKRADYFEANF